MNKYKIGDIIYCINNDIDFEHKHSNFIKYLKLDTPYIIKNPDGGSSDILLEESPAYFNKNRFISKREYKLSKRLEKITKIINKIQIIF